jgi:nucleoside-diphosphate-sugar epimerase
MLSHAFSTPAKPNRVVVLGTGGFIGRRLRKLCETSGIEHCGLGSGDIDLAQASAGMQLAERLRPQDVLVFLAALTPDKGRDSGTLMRNLSMARCVCEAAGRVELAQLVYASSDAVYSFATSLISEETPAVPVDLYGVMHRTRELMLASEAKAPLAILRFTAVYGDGDTHNSDGPNRFVRQAREEGRIALFGEGEETRDHLHIGDAAEVIGKVVVHRSAGLLNVATGRSETFRHVADLIAARAGHPVKVIPSLRQNPPTHRHFDTTNLIRAFPAMHFKSIEEGLPASLAGTEAASRG